MVMCAYHITVNLLQTFKGTLTIPLVSVCIMVCCKDCPLYGKQCSGMRLDLTCEEIVGKYYVNLVLTNKYGDDWKFNIVDKKENKSGNNLYSRLQT